MKNVLNVKICKMKSIKEEEYKKAVGMPELNKSEKNDLLTKLRNVVERPVKKTTYEFGNEDIYHPTKNHNDIEIGPGGNTAQIGINENFRKIIREIVEDIMSEDYPESFSFEEFQNISSYSGKVKYAEKNLQRLSSGSARVVYKVDEEKVLKVAKNKKGIAQNSVEAEGWKQNYGIVAKVFETDEDDYWIEMELAKKISPKSFKQITGVDIKQLEYYLYYEKSNYTQSMGLTEEEIEHMYNNEFVSELMEFIHENSMIYPGDFAKLSTYGEVIREGTPSIVLIDFGLTKSVYYDYYAVN